ncbi:DMT family transporter [Pantoea ananatis]|uniref:DMT family transporter n=1 Tax=Pantoea ananas TaxID=553 RepID=UPI001B30E542|nr:DMT family transporter [Pantoea ananatis]
MQKTAVVILFLIVTLTWGTTWLAMQIAVQTVPPLFATGMRFIFAAPFLITIAYATKTPLLFPSGQRLFQVIISIFYFSIPFTLMIYGEKYVSSGLASVIFSTMPVAVMVASVLILRTQTNALQIAGLALSTIALTCIIFNESKSGYGGQWLGVLALITAVIMHSILYTCCKKRSCNVSVITFNALPCLLAGILLIITGWVSEKPDLHSFSASSILATFYLGAFAGVFGILCYFALQKKAGAFKASLVFLIFPVIAFFLENKVYGNSISISSLFLIIPLLTGILLSLIPVKNPDSLLKSDSPDTKSIESE